MSFITPFGAYYYMTMSFGLKNAGATYQRAIQQCLKDEIRDQLIEAYVDDVVVKTKVASRLVNDLEQTFKALNTFQWKLNPKKYIFGVPSGILLGNIVSRDGIRPNPEKNLGCLEDEAAEVHQVHPEAYRVHGCSKSFHITAQREGSIVF
jgi:hypothetical protein